LSPCNFLSIEHAMSPSLTLALTLTLAAIGIVVAIALLPEHGEPLASPGGIIDAERSEPRAERSVSVAESSARMIHHPRAG
jgi:hypothetical protein